MRKIVVAIIALLTISGALVAPAGAKNDSGGGNILGKDYVVLEDLLPFDALDGATSYSGMLGDAGYRIEVPKNWNGDLVMWAHGYAGTGLEIFPAGPPDGTGADGVPDGSAEFRQTLIADGYAWAASTYSTNDFIIKTPAQETRLLADEFKELTGLDHPDEIYLTGVSMGGEITTYSAEQYGNFYTGVMPVCGVLGDRELFDFFLDFNLAAQQLGGADAYPVSLADPASLGAYYGVDATMPGAVNTIKANLEASSGAWPFALNEAGQNLKDLTELESGGVRPNFDQAWDFWNGLVPTDSGAGFLFDLAVDTGTVPIDKQFNGNDGEVYQFDTDPNLTDAETAFNNGILRVQRDELNSLDREEIPAHTGRLKVPMLTMHNLGDLFVPFSMETIYAERVAARGYSDNLVQRAIRGVSHCGFTTAEYDRAFTDLVDWAEDDEKPKGDNVLDPAAIADPNYGCKFTDGIHVLAEPCPEGSGQVDDDSMDDDDDDHDDDDDDDDHDDDDDDDDDHDDDDHDPLDPYPGL